MATESTPKRGKLGGVFGRRAPIRLNTGFKTTSLATPPPAVDEQPIAILRARIISLHDIVAKDSGGTSDPYVIVTLLGKQFKTPVIKKTLDPVYPPDEATFDFPVYATSLDQMAGLELVIWDKDIVGDDYVGEAVVSVEDWFKAAVGYEDQYNEEFTTPIVSTRKDTPAQGVARLKLGFVAPSELHQSPDFGGLYAEILRRRDLVGPSLTSAPPTEGVGTLRIGQTPIVHHHETRTDSESEDETSASVASTDTSQKKTKSSARAFMQKFVSKVTGSPPAPSAPSAAPSAPATAAKATQHVHHDISGVVMLEINGAEDLPKLKNVTRTGWDMDPFCVVSFGRRVFRTRVVRHSLAPVWDEKLLFHVRDHETHFNISFAICDWDTVSTNDQICEVTLDVGELLKEAAQRDPVTGLYPATAADDTDLKPIRLQMIGKAGSSWEGKNVPFLNVRAKYVPGEALRQRFWRQYLLQYDTDGTNTWNRLEFTSMLDSLGSTLTKSAVDNLYTSHGKSVDDELTLEESVISLEAQLLRPDTERKKVGGIVKQAMDRVLSPDPQKPEALKTTGPTSDAPAPGQGADMDPDEPEWSEEDEVAGEDATLERIVNLQTCPLCHHTDLRAKSEIAAVNHLALCASGDWGSIDRMITDNYVTADQASRKWYQKLFNQVASGSYSIGANSANVIVQNRMTGQLEEEKMQIYVRLGIRLLYKGAKAQMEGVRARRLLKSLSVKQGLKYDNPASAAEIPGFIEFHHLDVNEILDPLDSFKNFNEFFYRKLKPSARPVADLTDPTTLVSAADCRLMTFDTISEAQKIWIKGRNFTVARLLGEEYKDQADKFIGGALAIFRLAPQDYHRYHVPVDGTIGKMTYIEGEYYTVNPQAIRTQLDVYGENARKIVPIYSPVFGTVMCVCIGAMMVGSIISTVKEGQTVKRGDEFGYFAFGGSTIVCLFEKDKVRWDEDLRINSRAPLETLVRVGMRLGKHPSATVAQ